MTMQIMTTNIKKVLAAMYVIYSTCLIYSNSHFPHNLLHHRHLHPIRPPRLLHSHSNFDRS